MTAITDLSSAASVAAADYFVINQSGTDKKAQLLNLANTWAAVQTFTTGINTGDANVRPHISDNAHSLDVAEGSTVTLANTATMALSSNSTFSGLVLIVNGTDGQAAIFLCAGATSAEVSDPGNKYSKTQGTATSTNLYYSGDNKYIVENNTGGSRTYNIFTIRLRASS